MSGIDREVLHKEIDLIQSCINRMASNSFLVKGWSISVVAVVLALSDKRADPLFLLLVVLVPLLSFWYLDSFFLYTERLYRAMYSWVLNERITAQTDAKLYDLNPHRFKGAIDQSGRSISHTNSFVSSTLLCFYGTPLVMTMLVIGYLWLFGTKSPDAIVRTEIVNTVRAKIDTVDIRPNAINVAPSTGHQSAKASAVQSQLDSSAKVE